MDHFLQSEGWAKFQEAMGNQVVRSQGAFAYLKNMKFGLKHLYLPYVDIGEAQIQDWRTIAHEMGADFIRYEPISEKGVLKGFHNVKDFQPSHTLILDLSLSEDDLLAAMHSKTRYNVNLARKRGVTCRLGDKSEFEKFWKLISSTYSRKDIYTHSREYYYTLLHENPDAFLVFAEYDGTVIVANLMIRFGKTATYVHGGSHGEYRNLMAPHLLQWHEIVRAKEDGYRWYDFWGIAPTDEETHPWAGITRFKKGFGGQAVKYPGTFEKAETLKYQGYRLLRKLRS